MKGTHRWSMWTGWVPSPGLRGVRTRGAAGGSDTSPIIALAHIRRLELVKTLYGSVLIPPSVKTECIDRGRAIGARDVYEIEKRLQQGWITVVPLGKNSEREATQLMARARIGQGKAEAIMLAKERGAPR